MISVRSVNPLAAVSFPSRVVFFAEGRLHTDTFRCRSCICCMDSRNMPCGLGVETRTIFPQWHSLTLFQAWLLISTDDQHASRPHTEFGRSRFRSCPGQAFVSCALLKRMSKTLASLSLYGSTHTCPASQPHFGRGSATVTQKGAPELQPKRLDQSPLGHEQIKFCSWRKSI